MYFQDGHSTVPECDVAADQAECVVPTKDGQREVEGCYDTDQPQGVPLLHQHMPWPCIQCRHKHTHTHSYMILTMVFFPHP